MEPSLGWCRVRDVPRKGGNGMSRKVVVSLVVVAVLVALAVAGYAFYTGAIGGARNTLTLGPSYFRGTTSLTIRAGQAVTFDDPGYLGGTHHLVTGMSGQFSAEAGAPSEFATAAGIMFSPGDHKSITFPTAGTYHITCTIHPSMQATITVT